MFSPQCLRALATLRSVVTTWSTTCALGHYLLTYLSLDIATHFRHQPLSPHSLEIRTCPLTWYLNSVLCAKPSLDAISIAISRRTLFSPRRLLYSRKTTYSRGSRLTDIFRTRVVQSKPFQSLRTLYRRQVLVHSSLRLATCDKDGDNSLFTSPVLRTSLRNWVC